MFFSKGQVKRVNGSDDDTRAQRPTFNRRDGVCYSSL